MPKLTDEMKAAREYDLAFGLALHALDETSYSNKNRSNKLKKALKCLETLDKRAQNIKGNNHFNFDSYSIDDLKYCYELMKTGKLVNVQKATEALFKIKQEFKSEYIVY